MFWSFKWRDTMMMYVKSQPILKTSATTINLHFDLFLFLILLFIVFFYFQVILLWVFYPNTSTLSVVQLNVFLFQTTLFLFRHRCLQTRNVFCHTPWVLPSWMLFIILFNCFNWQFFSWCHVLDTAKNQRLSLHSTILIFFKVLSIVSIDSSFVRAMFPFN